MNCRSRASGSSPAGCARVFIDRGMRLDGLMEDRLPNDALARQKRTDGPSNLRRPLQEHEVVGAAHVDDRVLRKPREFRPRVRDDGGNETQQTLSPPPPGGID